MPLPAILGIVGRAVLGATARGGATSGIRKALLSRAVGGAYRATGASSVPMIEKAVEADQEAAATEGTAAADTETTTNNNQTKHTILTLSKAIAADAATIGIPAEVTFYDRLGITEEEVEQMKGELA